VVLVLVFAVCCAAADILLVFGCLFCISMIVIFTDFRNSIFFEPYQKLKSLYIFFNLGSLGFSVSL
jgi:hypothetical protein